ncbi:hypothetical protein GCM10023264_10960 [Sphingomonas daechungensis]|uniref:DUF4398 domain-containing protein n=1 Tax=Sphingomonas daechungensis TaxID=1176646 RepID=A0ABX6T7B3_9SPHN|nr:hypothetical protein [Sphingomonas daechungensis]QNP44588.1 hypothetical protein H9L15_16005 [Sphingomonas daechungensis]
MRPLLAAIIVFAAAACQRTAEQRAADELRNDAQQEGASVEKRAASEADRLEQQASDLGNEANQAGGMTGKRLNVRAQALNDEAKIVRKQADMKADAIKESADARIKASKSR